MIIGTLNSKKYSDTVYPTRIKDVYLLTNLDNYTWREYLSMASRKNSLATVPTSLVLIHKLGGEVVNLVLQLDVLVAAIMGLEVELQYGKKLSVNTNYFSVPNSLFMLRNLRGSLTKTILVKNLLRGKEEYTPEEVITAFLEVLKNSKEQLEPSLLDKEHTTFRVATTGEALPSREQGTGFKTGVSARAAALEQLDEKI